MNDKWTTKERARLLFTIIGLVFIALVWIKECSAQGLGGYGGLTIEQKHAKNMRRARDNAIRAQLRLSEQRARVMANQIRRANSKANYWHNQRMLERHIKCKK